MQARTACFSTITVHEPQSAWPQPNFVPVNPISSRRNQSNGRVGSPSQLCSWPLIFILIMIVSSLFISCRCLIGVSKNMFPNRSRHRYRSAHISSNSRIADLADKPHTSPTFCFSVCGYPPLFFFDLFTTPVGGADVPGRDQKV